MVFKKILDHAVEHKKALIFAGGIATAIVGKKILESQAVKDATTNCVAGALAVKQDAEDKLAEIKEDAEAQVEDAEETEEEAEEVEEEEEKPKKTKKSKKTKK